MLWKNWLFTWYGFDMQCPLCKQELLEIHEGPGAEKDYICRVRVIFKGYNSLPHYELREGYCPIWYIPPYKIVYYHDQARQETKVYKAVVRTHRFERPTFEHIFTVEQVIHPDTPEKLLARIKLLTIMS
jgi:hypothetical protein